MKLSMHVSGRSGSPPQPQLSFRGKSFPSDCADRANCLPLEQLPVRVTAFNLWLAICKYISPDSNVYCVLMYPVIKAKSSKSGFLLSQPRWECVYPRVKCTTAPHKHPHSLALNRLDQKLVQPGRSVLTTNTPKNFLFIY